MVVLLHEICQLDWLFLQACHSVSTCVVEHDQPLGVLAVLTVVTYFKQAAQS